jgi:ribosomal protein S18 acetylase RimI-like enzyme
MGATDLPGSDPGGADLELKRIYALSRFHGSGMGAQLMLCAVEAARERGARRLLLGVYAGNERAQAFYAKSGFKRIADRRFRVGDRDYDDIVFARALA